MMRLTSYVILTFLLIGNLFSQDVTNKTKADSNKVEWSAILAKEGDLLGDTAIKEECKAQWAWKVVKYSSQFSKADKAAMQILGQPNVMPRGGEAPTAWAVKFKDGKEADKNAFIRVEYENPSIIQQVVIAESFNPGAITKITLYGPEKQELVVYEGTAQSVNVESRMVNIFLDKPTDFPVEQLEIRLNPIAVAGLNQIDAVGVAECMDTVKAKINLIPNLVYGDDPENLGENINSIYDEDAPMISPDGKTIYFVRKFHPENIGGVEDEDDIWYSVVDQNNKWRPARNIGMPLNNKFNNFIQAITPDGNQLLLGNAYLKNNTMSEGVSMTHRTRQGWDFPKKQLIDGFINYNKYANYYLTNDGKAIIMAIEMKDTYGGLDLYVSFRISENRWSKPKNLGLKINTPTNDYSPFLAADGVTLYYSTSGLPGYGEADIYRVTRLDDTWENWSEPQNLGEPINSAGTDSKYNIPASGEYAYYSSTNNTIGKKDIFRILLPKTVKPNPVVLITGYVRNDKTNAPVDARIIVEELPGGEEVAIARTDPKTGKFKIILPAGKKYGFRAVGLGYFDVNKNIDLTDIDEYTEMEIEAMRMSPIEVGQVVRLNNIFFETGKATLKPESFPELDRTVEFLKNNPTMEIEIAGHTDNVGSETFNQKLSENRAKSVEAYIVEHGINESRLKAVGYGESRPIAFNSDDEGRQKNRRVEFEVLKK